MYKTEQHCIIAELQTIRITELQYIALFKSSTVQYNGTELLYSPWTNIKNVIF